MGFVTHSLLPAGPGRGQRRKTVTDFDLMTSTDPDPETSPARPETEQAHPLAPLKNRAWLFAISALVIVLDQITKAIVEQQMVLYTSWAPIPGLANLFQFTHAINYGAAFGLFQESGRIFAVVALIVAGVIIYYNHRLPAGHWLLRTALGLQLGGALGNLIDRMRQGYVTDFLDFGPWPVFNLADTAIVAGVALLALLMLQEMWAERREGQATAANADVPAATDSVASLTGMTSVRQDDPASS